MRSIRKTGRAGTSSASRSGRRGGERQRVSTGLDLLVEDRLRALRGRKVGLVCNPTAVDAKLRHAADLLHAAPGVALTRLFGPEHGIRGDAQYMAAVREERDSLTGLPVVSLYGATRDSLRPARSLLEGIDLLVFDIQDVGARYYTYQATMMLCMEAAAEARICFMVLDRPNPIGGLAVEGPALRPGFESFCGLHDLSVRHGMTIGELALLFLEERRIDLELEVVPCRGWHRDLLYRETGLPWIWPSPNMPTPETALVYPGMCLVEGTNLSEGRGTTRPFEIFGAPWLDADQLATTLNAEGLAGVRFRPVSFVPMWDKHAGTRCNGAELAVTDRVAFRPFRTGIACIRTARAQSPSSFSWRTEPYEFVSGIPAFDLLCGSDRERRAIEDGAALGDMAKYWAADERAFGRRRAHLLRYPVQESLG